MNTGGNYIKIMIRFRNRGIKPNTFFLANKLMAHLSHKEIFIAFALLKSDLPAQTNIMAMKWIFLLIPLDVINGGLFVQTIFSWWKKKDVGN